MHGFSELLVSGKGLNCADHALAIQLDLHSVYCGKSLIGFQIWDAAATVGRCSHARFW
ncbi:MAG: hypothetical protein AABY54_06955 [Deltaproteobacteria bacterium]